VGRREEMSAIAINMTGTGRASKANQNRRRTTASRHYILDLRRHHGVRGVSDIRHNAWPDLSHFGMHWTCCKSLRPALHASTHQPDQLVRNGQQSRGWPIGRGSCHCSTLVSAACKSDSLAARACPGQAAMQSRPVRPARRSSAASACTSTSNSFV